MDHVRSTGLPALDHPSLPQGQLVYAVGDIHGRADLLAALLAKITSDVARREGAGRRTLVFLGDYIDRGPDSKEVVDLLLTGLPGGFDAHFLKGNHEAIMMAAPARTAASVRIVAARPASKSLVCRS